MSGQARLIVNTRTSLALVRAGIPESQWVLRDVTNEINQITGNPFASEMERRLIGNGLYEGGTDFIRVGPRPGFTQNVPIQGTIANEEDFSYLD